MRKVIVLAFAAVAGVSVIEASVAGADSARVASTASPSCKQALIALTGPYTGANAALGIDQRGWGRGHGGGPAR